MTDVSWLGPPIEVRSLFAGQQAAFTALLRDLAPQEWSRPTACPGWSVHDVAAHVLGDHLGRLSMGRDGFHVLSPAPDEPFPAFLDRINEEWVVAARRISPPLLVEWLSATATQVADFWQSLDMDALTALVTWAGADPAPVWLDAARDFSEYWTHHQQISEATGRPGPDERFLAPVLDTFLRALPYTLQTADAPQGTLAFVVTGPGGGGWTCAHTGDRWALDRGEPATADARVTLDCDAAWRLCTRGIGPAEAAARARMEGDERLATAALTILSIIRMPD
ncbi:maleylpyruvate isomerase family mycothiol-dependent enzyme [Actinomadura fulvescens]|uniref:Maleylpyruvate isomerase family mycothiol-dependent enzyme n=1 Tax=Actinomadura fulvescens TaxID=46160 RepID=A0ABN3QQR7_9ACTN